MTWTKHFSVIKTAATPVAVDRSQAYSTLTARTSSWLNIAYQGNPQRIPRYYQFQEMDSDSDINTALDTIADFCTQSEEQADEPFDVKYSGEPNESETKIVKQMLEKWIRLNTLRSRLWYMFRDTIKNGDAFFLRDPETHEWLWLDHFMVELVKVDETKGKIPDEYIIRGLDYNRQAKFGSQQADPNAYRTPFGTATIGGARPMASGTSGPAAFNMAGSGMDQRQRGLQGPYAQELSVVDAHYVVHLSLSIGNDINWPFGSSILEPIFKTYKQKELLEDAIIIYRVQRAPERRIFYIDVGTMPPERAKRHIESIKNDIHQRRIPNRTGGGSSILDAAYNPLCLSLNTIIHLVDGRSLCLADLIMEYKDGKENWVYSCDPISGKIVEGPITWAGITKRDTEVVCVTLDNGGAVIVTPDHKFPTFGGELVKASDLTPNHELIAFERYTRNGQRTGHGPDNMIVHPISVVPLQDKIDVGTITVDKTEKYHSFHNFAISENIFLQNSINDDYFFACLSLDTKILLLDGRSLSLQEIIDEHEQGKENWVYSQNRATHELEPGRITWAGITRKDAEMVRVTLDNGEYIDVTPDHRFISREGEEIAAGELKDGQSLMPLYLRYDQNAGNIRHLSNATGKTKFVHMTMCPKTGTYSLGRQRDDEVVAGYSSWGDFKNAYHPNHKVVSVEILSHRSNTGDITIETASGSHIFALAAGIYVHNSSSDGRGSKVETLPGGDGNNEILDLTYFSRKLSRGLRVPTSYLNIGSDESASGVTFNDGKLGAAMIQEYRFSKYCMRLQSLLAPVFDKEFKRYLQKNGIEIEPGLFELQFNPPQSFTRYRQIELDSQRVGVYQGLADNKKISERTKLKRYLGWSDEELLENEESWAQENAEKLKKKTGTSPAESGGGDGLGAVGIHPDGDMGLGMGGLPEEEPPLEGEPAGGAGGAPAGGGPPGIAAGAAPVAAGAPPPPA